MSDLKFVFARFIRLDFSLVYFVLFYFIWQVGKSVISCAFHKIIGDENHWSRAASARLKAAMNRIDINGTATWLRSRSWLFFLSPIVELVDKCHFIIVTSSLPCFYRIVDTSRLRWNKSSRFRNICMSNLLYIGEHEIFWWNIFLFIYYFSQTFIGH